VATAVSVDEIGFPAEGRHALGAGLAMLALRFECLQVVAEFLVLEHVLAALADLVVGVQAGSWVGKWILYRCYGGRQRRHFMCGACLHSIFCFCYGSLPFFSMRCRLTMQWMHMPFSP
jgi:hypothetical protein